MAQRFYFSRKWRRSWDCSGKFSSCAAAAIQLIQTHKNLSPAYETVTALKFPNEKRGKLPLLEGLSSASRFGSHPSHCLRHSSTVIWWFWGYSDGKWGCLHRASLFQLQPPCPGMVVRGAQSTILWIHSSTGFGVSQSQHCTAIPSCGSLRNFCFSMLNVQHLDFHVQRQTHVFLTDSCCNFSSLLLMF